MLEESNEMRLSVTVLTRDFAARRHFRLWRFGGSDREKTEGDDPSSEGGQDDGEQQMSAIHENKPVVPGFRRRRRGS
jgi:hypothetical protein